MDIVTSPEPIAEAMFTARALVLRDLKATDVATPEAVSALEASIAERQWWVEQWPEGVEYVAGLVAQDVQDALLSMRGRWPLCRSCDEREPHALHVLPDLGGPDPHWVCEDSGVAVAAVGHLRE